MSQRLSQGFQVCTPANDTIGTLDEINVATIKTLPDVLRDVHDGELTAIYLSLANQLHRISYDRRTQSVIVKILRRRRTWTKTDYAYGALIWTPGAKAHSYVDLTFPYPDLLDPSEWQHLDRLVAGLEKPDLRPTLRYWRTRLVLLPADKVPDRDFLIKSSPVFEDDPSDEEINLQGFFTLMGMLQSARWVTSDLETAEPTPTEMCVLRRPPSLVELELTCIHAAPNSLPRNGPARRPARSRSSPRKKRLVASLSNAPPAGYDASPVLPPATNPSRQSEIDPFRLAAPTTPLLPNSARPCRCRTRSSSTSTHRRSRLGPNAFSAISIGATTLRRRTTSS